MRYSCCRSGMKKRALTCVGDGRIRALLGRYACPTSFHIVRTRLLGNIATPKLKASPFRTIERLWGGNLLEFDDASAANELFEALMGLWNDLVKHQSRTKPFRLTRVAVKAKLDDLRRLCRTRTEELEGLIEGLFGDERAIDLPQRANEALNNLGEINAMMRGIVDLLERETASPGSEEDLTGTSTTCKNSLVSRRRSFMPSFLPASEPSGKKSPQRVEREHRGQERHHRQCVNELPGLGR